MTKDIKKKWKEDNFPSFSDAFLVCHANKPYRKILLWMKNCSGNWDTFWDAWREDLLIIWLFWGHFGQFCDLSQFSNDKFTEIEQDQVTDKSKQTFYKFEKNSPQKVDKNFHFQVEKKLSKLFHVSSSFKVEQNKRAKKFLRTLLKVKERFRSVFDFTRKPLLSFNIIQADCLPLTDILWGVSVL